MHWTESEWLWAELVAAALLVTGLVVQASRRRRIRKFGDPELLGLETSRVREGISLLLFVTGIAAIVAILPLPVSRAAMANPGNYSVEILVDASLFDRKSSSQPERLMDEVEQVVRRILTFSGRPYFSLYRSGNSPTLLVPITSDGQGLLMLLPRMFDEYSGDGPALLRESLLEIVRREPAGGPWRRRIVVLTARPVDEVLLLLSELPDTPAIGVHLDSATPPGELQQNLVNSRWILSRQPEELRRLISGDARDTGHPAQPVERRIYLQYLAAIGFLAMLSEFLWSRFLKLS